MAWRDTLTELQDELRQALAQQLGEPVEEDQADLKDREELYRLAASLEIAQLLVDANEILLDGNGIVESSSMVELFDDEDLDDDDDADDEDEDDDVNGGEELRFSLSWEDELECAVDVELGKTEGRIFLLVNGEEVRHQRENLERAVIEAFKEEIDL